LFEKDRKLATRLFYSKNATETGSVCKSRFQTKGPWFSIQRELLAINAKVLFLNSSGIDWTIRLLQKAVQFKWPFHAGLGDQRIAFSVLLPVDLNQVYVFLPGSLPSIEEAYDWVEECRH
jgi:hypothetical protein